MAVKIEKNTIIGDVLDIAPQAAPLFFAIECDSFLAQLNHFLEAYEASEAEK